MSDSTIESLTVWRSRKSLIEIPYYDDYFVAAYRVYFDVTTDQVIGKCFLNLWYLIFKRK